MVRVWHQRRIDFPTSHRPGAVFPSTVISRSEIVWNSRHLQVCYLFFFQLRSTRLFSSCNEHLSILTSCANQPSMYCDASRKAACHYAGCGMPLRFRQCCLPPSPLWCSKYSSQTRRGISRLAQHWASWLAPFSFLV